jgi:hypothetical protein
MDQCKLEWKYCKISHIDVIRFTWTKFIKVTAISLLCFHNVINHEIYWVFFFSYLIHVQYIMPNCKIGHMDGIEQNVE